jgi:DNA-binding NarL/FixJ family response regulator
MPRSPPPSRAAIRSQHDNPAKITVTVAQPQALRSHDGAGARLATSTGQTAVVTTQLTELRVAFLVADGLSNPAIGAELFLSRRTVQTHVSHILAELGAQSRAEVAREAAGHPRVLPPSRSRTAS